jgi:mRNA-degrading endonuclease RelE of RelBE toxin-antitoxin system
MLVLYSEQASSDLSKFNHADRQLIAQKIEYLAVNFDKLKFTKKVTELKGTKHKNIYKFLIARKIRVIFKVENEKLVLLILRIGLRKNIYDRC